MTQELQQLPDFLMQKAAEAEPEWGSKQRFRNVTVYNRNIAKWEKKNDTEKAWKMYFWKVADWVEAPVMTWSILLVRKSFYWFVPNVLWSKDMYWSNQMWIFDKWPAVLQGFKKTEEKNENWEMETIKTHEIFWPLTVEKMKEFLTEKDWQFFDQMKTPMDWSKPYATSHVSNHYHVYFQEETTKEIFEIDPKASYGKWKDIEEWTLEDVKTKWKELAKEAWLSWFDISMLKVELSCVDGWNFFRLNWNVAWFISEDNSEAVTEVRNYVTEFNNWFTWIEAKAEIKEAPVAPTKQVEAPKAPAKKAPAKKAEPAEAPQAKEVPAWEDQAGDAPWES